MNGCRDGPGAGAPANVVLVERSGLKREIPQSSAGTAMIEAEQAIRRWGRRLREIKLVSHNKAIARWKPGELGWRRVA